jgi:hypothetical protein
VIQELILAQAIWAIERATFFFFKMQTGGVPSASSDAVLQVVK